MGRSADEMTSDWAAAGPMLGAAGHRKAMHTASTTIHLVTSTVIHAEG
jgi:hypothetical protein